MKHSKQKIYKISDLRSFHLAVPVHDLEFNRKFYTNVLGCTTDRESDRWIDYNFFGHQLVTHLDLNYISNVITNLVDGDQVPSRHFGIVLKKSDWKDLARKLQKSGIEFIIGPRTRFKGKTGEQSTSFIMDPSGNALEFKAFADDEHIFRQG